MRQIRFGTYVLIVTLLLFMCAEKACCETLTLLDAATSTGAGPLRAVTFADLRTWTCDVTVSDNTTTAITVMIQGNQTGDLVFDPGGMAEVTFTPAQIAARRLSFSMVDMPARYLRANVITLTGGTSPAITVTCTGVR